MSTDIQAESASQPSSDIQVPSTPIQLHAALSASQLEDAPVSKASSSPPRSSSAEMTPPPSSQQLHLRSPPIANRPLSRQPPYLASPPATVKVNNTVVFPSDEEITTANEQELRTMVRELVGAVREARISAAHSKLQHSLLTMESYESAQRAEIEHQMTRREMEVIRAENRSRQGSMQPLQARQQSPQYATEPLLSRCRELEWQISNLDKKLFNAKRLIQEERDRADLIQEENLLLKRRIRENRDHITRMKTQSSAFTTPQREYTTPQRRQAPLYTNTGETQNSAIDALLAAGQVISGEPISVPSTPTKTPASRLRHGHHRGAHSLSSLQSTPGNRSRSDVHVTRKPAIHASGSQISFSRRSPSRHDRDSTISVSGSEGDNDNTVLTDEELPQSQASSLATSMLRRNPGVSSQDTLPSQGTPASAEKQSNLLQTKLFGQVKKNISTTKDTSVGKGIKRTASFGEDVDIAEKKRRVREGVGLGIGSWESTSPTPRK